MNDAPDNRTTQIKFEIAYRTAIVAAIFAVTVGALLAFSYSQRMVKDPFEQAAFKQVRDDLSIHRDDEQLRVTLRELDQQLRNQYFEPRRFAKVGAWLLLACVALALATARWAFAIRRPLPSPSGETSRIDVDERISRFGRWAVAALTAIIFIWAAAMAVTMKSSLPRTAQELAERFPELVATGGDGDSTAVVSENGNDRPLPTGGNNGHTEDPVTPAVPDYPSEEELQANWHRFRGYQGRGVSTFADPPTSWDGEADEGILWKTAVPLPGNNSPVVWQDRVFLTGATEEEREVYCFAAGSGELLWQFEAKGTPESTAKPPELNEATGFAAPTAVVDGRCVYAMFANGDVVAVDFAGKQRWARSLGIPVNCYGHAASLALHRDRLIIQFDQALKKDEKSRLLALDVTSGETVWETSRDVPNSWPSPIVIEHEGLWQVIACADPWVVAYAADDGRELWRCKCLQGDVGPSPVYHDGVVHVANEFPGYAAIRVGGSGDVTDSHLLREAEDGAPDCCGPLVTDDFVLLVASYGTLSCYDARTDSDEPLWEEDFDGTFTASPTLAGSHVYLFDDEGQVWIVEPTKDECKQVAQNNLGEECVTSPAFQDGRLFIRGKEHLFCIGKAEGTE